MTIVEPRFATSILTEKGRTLKFDAVECLANFVLSEDKAGNDNTGNKLFVSIDEIGTMTAIENAFFIISDSIRTPMGGGVVAYDSEQPGAKKWPEILTHFREMGPTPH